MPALSTYVGTTEATHIVSVEEIDAFLAGYNHPPPIGPTVAGTRQGKGTVPHRFPRLGAISVPAGTLAETVDAVDVNVSTAEDSLTPARVAFAVPISDRLVMNQVGSNVPGEVLAEAINATWQRIDSDTLAGSTGATQSTGAITDVFTLDHLRAVKAAWRAYSVMPGPFGTALVVHGDALSALEASARSSGSPWALSPSDNPTFGLVHGYQGRLGEFELFSSNQVADESTGHSNFVTPIGILGGLGLVMSKAPSITLWRGNDGLRRGVTYAHVEVYFAAGITNNTRFMEALSA